MARDNNGNQVLYWGSFLTEDKSMAINLFGHGTPGDAATLNIDVQLNTPIVSFSRRSGGAFLRHLPTGRIVLAHRGIVTLGHRRVQKSILLSAMAAIEAKTGNENSDFLFIGELDSPTLINEIDAFSSDLRQLVRALEGSSAYNRGVGPSIKVSGLAGRLRQYFDEFSRLRKLKGQKPSAADCYHGSVVRAIRDHFDGSVQALKNKEIDLTVVNKKRIFLFEVKTSAQTQSVYTAVGQLAVHALGAVAATFNSKLPLIKVIVLPQQPTERLRKVLTELGICLITFTRSKNGRITIKGLQAVVNGP